MGTANLILGKVRFLGHEFENWLMMKMVPSFKLKNKLSLLNKPFYKSVYALLHHAGLHDAAAALTEKKSQRWNQYRGIKSYCVIPSIHGKMQCVIPNILITYSVRG